MEILKFFQKIMIDGLFLNISNLGIGLLAIGLIKKLNMKSYIDLGICF